MDPRKIISNGKITALSPLHETTTQSRLSENQSDGLKDETVPPAPPPNTNHFDKSITQSPHTTRRKSIGALNPDGSPVRRSISSESYFEEKSSSLREPGKTNTSTYARGGGRCSEEDDDDGGDDWGKSQLSRTNVPFSDFPYEDNEPQSSPRAGQLSPQGDSTVEKKVTVPHLNINNEHLGRGTSVIGDMSDDPYGGMSSPSGRSFSTSSYHSPKERGLTTPSPRLTPQGKRSSLKMVSSFEEPGSTITSPNSSGKVPSENSSGKNSARKQVVFKKSQCLEYDISSPPAVTLVENGGRFRTKSNIPLEVSLTGVSDMPDVYPDDYGDETKKGKGANRPLGCCPIV